MLITDPDPWLRITSATAIEVFHTARTLRSKMVDHWASVSSNDGAW